MATPSSMSRETRGRGGRDMTITLPGVADHGHPSFPGSGGTLTLEPPLRFLRIESY